jgi:hypothetical protein
MLYSIILDVQHTLDKNLIVANLRNLRALSKLEAIEAIRAFHRPLLSC